MYSLMHPGTSNRIIFMMIISCPFEYRMKIRQFDRDGSNDWRRDSLDCFNEFYVTYTHFLESLLWVQ
jgi:hypothetical protein